MSVPTLKVAALSRFIDEVIRVRNEWESDDQKSAIRDGDEPDPQEPWFRGQGNSSWKLQPKLYRSAKKFNENELRTEFKRRAFQLMNEPRVPKDDREWYFLMQHYGSPTRLLDWTDGALIALYFAVKSQRRHASAAVWMLDPVWLNNTVLNENDESNYISGIMLPDWKEAEPWFPVPFEESLHVTYPVAIDPPHIARRVSVQRSRFTIHGSSKRGIEEFVANVPKSRLVKFVIPNKAGKLILKDLSTCGIVETSVYPDLEGLSRELETKWAELGFAEKKSRKAIREQSR